MMKIKSTTIFLLFLLFLAGCNNKNRFNSISSSSKLSTNYSIKETAGTNEEILAFESEEKQFERSNLVLLVKAQGYGKIELINNKPYTIYYFTILRFYKGNEKINFAYFYGNTTDTSNVVSSIDERLIENEEYKLYLRKIDSKYVTTSGFQSIIRQ